MSPFLDTERQQEHRTRNLVHSVLLISGLAALMLACFWLVWGWKGALVAAILVAALMALAPRVPPEAVMRMYRAHPVSRVHGAQLMRLVDVLADRAELPSPPDLYVVPSTTLNAFATGTPERAVIAVTEGLLRRLSLREIAGVIAHEMSHIRNNDLLVMGLADVMTRLTQVFPWIAVFLAIFNVLAWLTDGALVSWIAIVMLYLAPTASSLLQLGLSRTREYDADLEAANLTGDPQGLASALQRLEQYQGRFWEDLMLPVPGRRVPQPSLLRTHPSTTDRVARLDELTRGEAAPRRRLPQIIIIEEPMVTMVGVGPAELAPRVRWSGVWY